jgi:glutathione S-transferase
MQQLPRFWFRNPKPLARSQRARSRFDLPCVSTDPLIGDDLLAGREYFFDHFIAPDACFFWCCRRATQLEVDISGFPNVAAHFKRLQERPSVRSLARASQAKTKHLHD